MSKYMCVMKLRKTLYYISKIKESSNRFIVDELKKQGIVGIVPSHGGILIALYEKKEMTMKEIAEKINRTQPTVTVLVDKLIQHGYVKKQGSPDDARVAYIRLTPKGENFREIFFNISENMNQKIHKNLNSEEADMLEKLLERISKE